MYHAYFSSPKGTAVLISFVQPFLPGFRIMYRLATCYCKRTDEGSVLSYPDLPERHASAHLGELASAGKAISLFGKKLMW